jgi:hypothetical protein
VTVYPKPAETSKPLQDRQNQPGGRRGGEKFDRNSVEKTDRNDRNQDMTGRRRGADVIKRFFCRN